MKINANNMLSKARRFGFTLIELMVILSMIMFLTSLLVPALNQVKKISIHTTCANNLREISSMAMLYSVDHNGYVLPCRFKNEELNHPLRPYNWDYWQTILAVNYLKDHKPGDGYHEVLRCPGEDSSGQIWNNYGINTQSRFRNGVSAAPAHSNPSAWPGGKYHRITDFHQTSETMFFMDWWISVMFEYGGLASSQTDSIDRHGTGLNTAFLDGRVDLLDVDDIPANTWTDTFWSGL